MGAAMTTETPRVYLDANVFIAAFENPGSRSDHAWWIIEAIENGEIVGATSELTLAEVLVKPIELGDVQLVDGYERMIAPGPGFEVLPVQRAVLLDAARLRARRASLRLPDAIHVASARAMSCRFIVSNDSRLTAIDDLKTLPLSPFTLDDILKEER
jgi:predicted nucleic acid-binding protein